MAPRINVLEEFKIDYEVPFITDRGEIIDTTTVQINEKRQGIDISYGLLNPIEDKVKSLFPAEGVDNLARMLKHIFQDLEMHPSRIILQLWEHSPGVQIYSAEGRAPVNKQRDTVLIILTKTPFIYKFGHELVLWHQAMHAKDRWEYRFPSAHPLVEVGEWLDVLWHFSLDGRLQKLGKPHYSKIERLEEANRLLDKLCHIEGLQDRVRELCDELWGMEVTLAQLLEIGRSLGLEPRLPFQKGQTANR
jgi:hypothetical protein